MFYVKKFTEVSYSLKKCKNVFELRRSVYNNARRKLTVSCAFPCIKWLGWRKAEEFDLNSAIFAHG